MMTVTQETSRERTYTVEPRRAFDFFKAIKHNPKTFENQGIVAVFPSRTDSQTYDGKISIEGQEFQFRYNPVQPNIVFLQSNLADADLDNSAKKLIKRLGGTFS